MGYMMSVGRDYRTNSRYQYLIFKDEEVIARKGFYTTSTQAKREGIKAGKALIADREGEE